MQNVHEIAVRLRWRIWLTGIFVIFCAAVWAWALRGSFGACVKGTTSDTFQKAVASIDGTIELGIKISVAVIGVTAAALIGLKAGIRMTPTVKLLLLLGVMLFGQSAIMGVLWRLKLANSWLNECLNLVSEEVMQRLFAGCLIFFLSGLVVALVMLCFAAYMLPEKASES